MLLKIILFFHLICVLNFVNSANLLKSLDENTLEEEELIFVENDDEEPIDQFTNERKIHPHDNHSEIRRTSRWQDPEKTTEYWIQDGQCNVRNQILKKANKKVAKNVIFFLGDGMGISTITASRIYSGQLNGKKGEDCNLAMDKFPFTGLSKTFCVDKQTADSACSATAYLCGVKTNFLTLGVNANVTLKDCAAANDPANRVYSLAYHAQQAGKSTGIVTTVTVTHASPGGAFGHTAHRIWECDADIVKMGEDPNVCEDLATQLVTGETGSNFNVILGGGRTKFFSRKLKDSQGNVGERLDGKNLITEWRKRHKNGRVVFSKSSLEQVNFDNTDSLLGLFAPGYMEYNVDADRSKEPSLTEMTLAAIKMVEKNPDGYFLFIEGGKIDVSSHENKARIAVDETYEFSKAIQAALDYVNLDETLIIATADHSHALTLSGYADRGFNVMGTMDSIDETSNKEDDVLNLPFAILNYATGAGRNNIIDPDGHEMNLNNLDMTDPHFQYPAIYNTPYASHTGEDVSVYAIGPHSHLFSGVYGQHVIPHLIQYASCTGRGLNVCNTNP